MVSDWFWGCWWRIRTRRTSAANRSYGRDCRQKRCGCSSCILASWCHPNLGNFCWWCEVGLRWIGPIVVCIMLVRAPSLLIFSLAHLGTWSKLSVIASILVDILHQTSHWSSFRRRILALPCWSCLFWSFPPRMGWALGCWSMRGLWFYLRVDSMAGRIAPKLGASMEEVRNLGLIGWSWMNVLTKAVCLFIHCMLDPHGGWPKEVYPLVAWMTFLWILKCSGFSSFHNVVVGCELDFSLAKTDCQGTSMASTATRQPLWIGPSRGRSIDSGSAFLWCSRWKQALKSRNFDPINFDFSWFGNRSFWKILVLVIFRWVWNSHDMFHPAAQHFHQVSSSPLITPYGWWWILWLVMARSSIISADGSGWASLSPGPRRNKVSISEPLQGSTIITADGSGWTSLSPGPRRNKVSISEPLEGFTIICTACMGGRPLLEYNK